MIKRLFLSLLLLSIAHVVHAAPSITADPTITGSTIIITGTGFGTKATAAPVRFDNFEGLTVGNTVAEETSWWANRSDDANTNFSVISSDNNRTGSSRNMKSSVGTEIAGNPLILKKDVLAGTSGEKFIVSMWIRHDWGHDNYTPTEDVQMKVFRLSANIAATNGDATYPQIFLNTWWYLGADDEYDEDDYAHEYLSSNFLAEGTQEHRFASNIWGSAPSWHQVIAIVDQGTKGNADGYFEAWLSQDGDVYSQATNGGTQQIIDATGDYIQDIKIETYLDLNGAAASASMTWYYDDIYIDKGWSRVEIGDNATYANCTHREIQPPTAWATGEVTATFNKGTFDEGDTAYVFIVDSDNVVSAGRQFTVPASQKSVSGGTANGGSF